MLRAMKPGSSRRARGARLWLQIGLAIICLGGVGRFVVRGAIGSFRGGGDFARLYAATRSWSHGENPYDAQVVTRSWEAGGGKGPAELEPVYPPFTFVVLSPICAQPWKRALPTWSVLNLVSVAVILESLRRVMQRSWADPRVIGMAVGFLALAPMTTAFSIGQMCLVSSAAVALALLNANDSQTKCGLWTALGACVKPQIALPWIGAAFVYKYWKALLAGGVALAGITAAALARLIGAGPWVASWLGNLHAVSGPGGDNDPTPANPLSLQLLNLHYPLHTFINSHLLVNVIVWAAAITLVLPALWLLRLTPSRSPAQLTDLLLVTSLLQIVGLLAIYHRSYDGVVVIFPAAWALRRQMNFRESLPILLLAAVLILPSNYFLRYLEGVHIIPAVVSSSAIWHALGMPFQCWVLFLMAVWLSILTARLAGSLTHSCPEA